MNATDEQTQTESIETKITPCEGRCDVPCMVYSNDDRDALVESIRDRPDYEHLAIEEDTQHGTDNDGNPATTTWHAHVPRADETTDEERTTAQWLHEDADHVTVPEDHS